MVEIWRERAEEYGITVILIETYQGLRSVKDHQPKNGLLVRHDNITEGGIHQISFTPTPEYLQLVANGVMVVADEIQNVKNNSAQYKALSALLLPIIRAAGISRFALLSGTPFDKMEHAINLLRMIGYIRAPRLYHRNDRGEIVLEGLQELIDACRFIDHAIGTNETDRILEEIPITKSKMNALAYNLYTRVIKFNISGAMPAPMNKVGRFDVKNGFFNMNAADAIRYNEGVQNLGRAARFNERTGAVDRRGNNMGAITTALVEIESSKVGVFARVATSILMASPANKVVIGINYPNFTLQPLIDLLIYYNPLVITGQTKQKLRNGILNTFNNDPTRRILIINTTVAGSGIDLHDTVGNSPRFMLLSPTYRMLDIDQAAARIDRDGRMSDATVRIIYGNVDGTLETRILSAMTTKSIVLRGTFDEEVTQDVILPGDYPSEREQDPRQSS